MLLQNSEKLGAVGKCVTVRAGYARNHLIPAGRAALASKANRAAYQRTDDEARQPVCCICRGQSHCVIMEGFTRRCEILKAVTSGRVLFPGKASLRYAGPII